MQAINSPQGGEKPVLITDVDGVFLIADEEVPGRCPPGYEPSPSGMPEEFYNPLHGEWLREILPDVDWFYLTDHNSTSHYDIGRHLQLPETPWVDFFAFKREQERVESELAYSDERRIFNLNHARRKAIDTFFPGRTLMWVEDSLTPLDFSWGDRRKAREAPTLLIKPDPAEGLQYFHIDRMKAWLGQLASS